MSFLNVCKEFLEILVHGEISDSNKEVSFCNECAAPSVHIPMQQLQVKCTESLAMLECLFRALTNSKVVEASHPKYFQQKWMHKPKTCSECKQASHQDINKTFRYMIRIESCIRLQHANLHRYKGATSCPAISSTNVQGCEDAIENICLRFDRLIQSIEYHGLSLESVLTARLEKFNNSYSDDCLANAFSLLYPDVMESRTVLIIGTEFNALSRVFLAEKRRSFYVSADATDPYFPDADIDSIVLDWEYSCLDSFKSLNVLDMARRRYPGSRLYPAHLYIYLEYREDTYEFRAQNPSAKEINYTTVSPFAMLSATIPLDKFLLCGKSFTVKFTKKSELNMNVKNFVLRMSLIPCTSMYRNRPKKALNFQLSEAVSLKKGEFHEYEMQLEVRIDKMEIALKSDLFWDDGLYRVIADW